jgi:hypothetical protein
MVFEGTDAMPSTPERSRGIVVDVEQAGSCRDMP